MRRGFGLLAAFAALIVSGSVLAESARSNPKSTPARGDVNDRPFVIAVMGDSLADGLWGSIYRGYIRQQREIVVRRHAVNSAGFSAHDFEADFAKVAKEPVDLIVFMVGANDRQRAFSLENRREWGAFRSEKWQRIYWQNAQRFIAVTQAKNVPLVWVGLPIMRKEDANEDARMMNGIYREVASRHGALFVDIWTVTANRDGEYDPFREDERGRKRRYRHDDGIHFTEFGYDHVARFVLKEVKERMSGFQALRTTPAP
jgi:hypothetical protein